MTTACRPHPICKRLCRATPSTDCPMTLGFMLSMLARPGCGSSQALHRPVVVAAVGGLPVCKAESRHGQKTWCDAEAGCGPHRTHRSPPIGYAGRTALGLGKRIGGKPAEVVATELQQRTAEQMFKVLGELKGGAMKFGQALERLRGRPARGDGRALPSDPDPAAGRSPADARRDRARGAGRAARPRLAGPVRRVRRRSRRGRLDRPGAPRGVARRPRQWRSRSSTPARARPS